MQTNSDPIINEVTLSADPLLAGLVVATEESIAEISISLLVNGLIVSGVMISEADYRKHAPIADVILERLSSLGMPTQFVHLRNAKYWMPGHGPMPSDARMFCRISLRDVQGFNLDEFENGQPT